MVNGLTVKACNPPSARLFQVLGPGFGSFYGTFVPLAKEILIATASPPPGGGGTATSTAPPQDTDLLRGKAMEAIALMGQAVGLEMFREDAHQASRVGGRRYRCRDRCAAVKSRYYGRFSLPELSATNGRVTPRFEPPKWPRVYPNVFFFLVLQPKPETKPQNHLCR